MPKQSRQLAVVLFSDIVGYSRLMGEDEQLALRALAENRRIHRESLEANGGVLVKEVGDGTLCRFSSALDAVHCAIDIQSKVRQQPYRLRLGMHLGDVLLTEDDIFGNSVNIAARVEALANPGAVFLTAQVVQSIRGSSNLSIAFLGEKNLKNIDEPIRIYGLQHEQLAEPVLPVTLDESGLVDGSILHYSVQEKLGSGGMGVVYKAVDTRLQRTVALKFLPPYLYQDEKAKTRFLREARTAAALQHPNICGIYDIEEGEQDRLFIAMEYVEGKNLEELLREEGRLLLGRVLDLAIQMADGLAEAHEKNIIHRDIKPSNLILDAKGQLKILDFGLAEIYGARRSSNNSVAGTTAYMSPEQARGETLDKRTDIWAVGVVLYELLAGHRPFQGDYDYAIVRQILHDEPAPLPVLRPDAPQVLWLLVKECLEKDRDYRLQTSADLQSALRRIKRDWETGALAAGAASSSNYWIPPSSLPRRTWIRYGGIAVLALFGGWLLAKLFGGSSTPSTAQVQQLSAFTALGGLAGSPTWSPDGEYIAYASDQAGSMDLWRKPVAGGREERLTTLAGHEDHPAWAPDGSKIAFAARGADETGIFIIPADGGTPTPLTPFGEHPAWAPDSERLLFDWNGDIFLVADLGQMPDTLVRGASATTHAAWTPDGRGFLYWNRTLGDLFHYDLASQKTTPLGLIPAGEEVAGISIDARRRRLIFSKGPFGGNKDLWSVPLDGAFQPTAPAGPLNLTTTDDIDGVLSPDGRHLAFTARLVERHLYRYPLDPATGFPRLDGDPQQLTRRGNLNYYPALSADGSKLAWTSHRNGKGSLYFRTLNGAEEQKVTSEWSPDTREIVPSLGAGGEPIIYASTHRGRYQLWRASRVGGVALQLTETENSTIRDVSPMLSPDGASVVFYSNRAGTWDIWRMEMNSGKEQAPVPLTDWPGNELYPMWSPDNINIAFIANQGGNADIWIMAADGSRPQVMIEHPARESWASWSADGRWFFFVSDRSGQFNLWAKPTSGGAEQPVTDFHDPAFGMPETAPQTKFALSREALVLPLERRRGEVYVLELE